MPFALKYEKENKLDELLPYAFDYYNLYTARAFLDFVNNPNAKNLPIYSKNGDFSQLKQIGQVGLYIIGENDSFVYDNAYNHLQIINKNSKNKNNIIKVIKDCGHTFKNKSQELSRTILEFVKEGKWN